MLINSHNLLQGGLLHFCVVVSFLSTKSGQYPSPLAGFIITVYVTLVQDVEHSVVLYSHVQFSVEGLCETKFLYGRLL